MQEAVTLVLLAGDRLVRADFKPGIDSPEAVHSAPRAGGSLAEAVGGALALGGRPRRRVWVLAEELWMQSITLSRQQIAGLSEEQIGQALSFEIEPFSGLPVAEGVVGFQQGREADGTPSFWVVEIALTDRDAIQRVVTQAGGRLAGIGHPGGVPRSLSGQPHSWQRLEYWESGLVWISQDATGPAQARVVTSLPPRSSLPSSGAFELLGASAPPRVPEVASDLAWQAFLLPEEPVLRSWLQQWRQASAEGAVPQPPTVPPAAAAPSPIRHLVAGLVGLAVVGLFCGVHAFWLARQTASLTSEQAQRTTAARQVEDLNHQNDGLRQRLAALDLAKEQRARIVRRRGAVGVLLRTLAENRPEEIVLRGIQAEGLSSMVVSGVSMEATAVDELGLVLAAKLRAAGWNTQPWQKLARRTLANSGPWDFAFRMAHEEATYRPAPSPASSSRAAR